MSKNTFIYRVEHISGKGLWQAEGEKSEYVIDSFSLYSHLCALHSKLNTAFEEDYPLKESEFFAFVNKKAFRKYIKIDWLEELKLLGFKILKIKIPSDKIFVFRDKVQCVFKKEDIISKSILDSL